MLYKGMLEASLFSFASCFDPIQSMPADFHRTEAVEQRQSLVHEDHSTLKLQLPVLLSL